jgi:hypothetical protein
MTRLSEKELRALARMARGGVILDREGRGLLGGRAVIDRATVSALTSADLIHVAAAAGVPHLTRAGRAVLARSHAEPTDGAPAMPPAPARART